MYIFWTLKKRSWIFRIQIRFHEGDGLCPRCGWKRAKYIIDFFYKNMNVDKIKEKSLEENNNAK